MLGPLWASLILISETLTRSFLVEIDEFVRGIMGKPELEGENLEHQRIVWMADANQSMIAELNAIFTAWEADEGDLSEVERILGRLRYLNTAVSQTH